METYHWFLLGMMAGLIPCFVVLAVIVQKACCRSGRNRPRNHADGDSPWIAARVILPNSFACFRGESGRTTASARTSSSCALAGRASGTAVLSQRRSGPGRDKVLSGPREEPRPLVDTMQVRDRSSVPATRGDGQAPN